jgi:prepilin-type N-terminal cleavage/methylation domain-containing protein
MVYRQQKSQSVAGFTLLELLVVVAMVGVLSAIAAPSWLSFLNTQKMNAARNDLASILRTAQTEAQSRQQSKQVSFSSTTFSVTVRNQFNSTGGINTTGGVVTTLGSGNAGNNFTLTAPSTSIVFDHSGRTNASTPFIIKITRNGSSTTQSCVIVTTLLGGLKAANNSMCNSFNSNPL